MDAQNGLEYDHVRTGSALLLRLGLRRHSGPDSILSVSSLTSRESQPLADNNDSTHTRTTP